MKTPKVVIEMIIGGLMMTWAGCALAVVTVGFSEPLSGPAAAIGKDQYDGLMLGLQQLNHKLGGQSVKVIKEDDQLKPEIGAQNVRKFIERDHVDVIVGLGFSNVLLGEYSQLKHSGVPALATNAGPSTVAGKKCLSNLFALAWQNDTAPEAAGKYAQNQGYKNVYLMAPNYRAGKDEVQGFQHMFKGKISGVAYTRVGQTDYSSEISQLQLSSPDAVFVFYPGGMGVNFVKQFKQAGLTGQIPLLSAYTLDYTTLPALKQGAIGGLTSANWAPALNNKASKHFVKAFEAKYNRMPSYYAAMTYDAANLLNVAVKMVGDKVHDHAALTKAIKKAGSKFNSVRGPFKFNSNNNPIQNHYIFKVVQGGDQGVNGISMKLVSTPLKHYKDSYYKACNLN